MKNTKRFLALLLAVVMVIGMVPTAWATETEPTETTVPETTVPETTVPETTVPETTVPETTVPETTVPETTVPETTVPETTVPETTVPEATVPETTVPETTVPETTVPETTVPETTEETVPEEEPAKAVYLIKGAKLYKDYTNAEEAPKVIDKWNTEIKIGEPITAEDGTTWYKFIYSNLLAELFNGYSYVKAADVVTDKCTCDAEADEHAAGCALYEHVPTSEVTVGDGNTVSVAGMPEDAALQIGEADEESLDMILGIVGAQYGGATTFAWGRSVPTPQRRTETVAAELFAYDISVLGSDNQEWQPDGEPVTVTLNIPDLEIGIFQKVVVAHMHDDEVKMINAVVDEEAETITFTTDGFSVFYGFIVDFEFNGLSYSIWGEDGITLSDLMNYLDIGYRVSAVTSVESSNPSALKVTPENNDWVLESVADFTGEVYLDLTFNDEEIISILMTSPSVRYYLDGTDWSMPTLTGTITRDSQGAAPSGSVVINEEQIYGSEIGDNETDESPTADLLIYARPGMAIRFTRYSSWTEAKDAGGINSAYGTDGFTSKDGTWRWVWGTDDVSDEKNNTDGAAKYNYVVLSDDITKVTETVFYTKVGDVGDSNSYKVCKVKIVIVPRGGISMPNAPGLLKTALANAEPSIADRFEIRTIKATMYDYDGLAFNKKYAANYVEGNDKTGYFAFASKTQGVDVDSKENIGPKPYTGTGNINGGGGAAIQNILSRTLDPNTKLPTMNFGQNVDLFGTNSDATKTVYNDVAFEFVYDNSNGYYTYNSMLNHAQYNNGTVQLYTQALSATDLIGSGKNELNTWQNGGFYPFADISKSIRTSANEIPLSEWQNMLDDPYSLRAAPYAKDLVSTAHEDSTIEMHYGLQMGATFYMPADGLTDNDEEIVYEFTGDDDLWVYIDDELVLDIGGGHTPVEGKINLTTGEVYVKDRYIVSKDASGKVVTEGPTEQKEIIENIADPSFRDAFHTIKIFYLERHAGVSNCRMRFNLPIVPENSVTVEKELTNQNGESLAVNPNVQYTFQLQYKNTINDVTTDDDFIVLTNRDYVLSSNDKTYKTDANGYFKLRAGETATFEGIERGSHVRAVEIKPEDDGYIYSETAKVTVINGKNNKTEDYKYGIPTGDEEMGLNQSINFAFANSILTQDLEIKKNVIGGTQGLADPNQNFTFTLDFGQDILETGELNKIPAILNGNPTNLTDDRTNHIQINLKHNDVLLIENIPVNMTYTLSEANPDTANNSFLNPVFRVKIGDATEVLNELAFGTNYEGVITGNDKNKVTKNAIVVDNRQQMNLIITKQIVKKVGNEYVVDTSANPDQSFKFVVEGKDGTHTAGFVTTVLIPEAMITNGTASKTVFNVPVGEYTIREVTAWSSRFTLVNDNNQHVNGTDIAGNSNVATFQNERTEIKWLDYENLEENVFTAKPEVTN